MFAYPSFLYSAGIGFRSICFVGINIKNGGVSITFRVNTNTRRTFLFSILLKEDDSIVDVFRATNIID